MSGGTRQVPLAAYVGAIHRQPSPHTLADESVERTSWLDQGIEVRQEVAVYRFADGAVIRRTVEQDSFPSDLACTECWITYEVLAHGDSGSPIHPVRQVFENACRESFWLAYHTTPA